MNAADEAYRVDFEEGLAHFLAKHGAAELLWCVADTLAAESEARRAAGLPMGSDTLACVANDLHGIISNQLGGH